nr:RNA-directed DNA polymerase, eukaryota [Tanacetum cinerariifolium]
MQKAKIRWAIEGDENSKYFHAIINKKSASLSIKGILVDDDWIDDPDLVKEEFRNHFENRFLDLVDFAKAYDSIIWDFLDDILTSFGFGSKWRCWIRGSLSSGKASILVNGSPSDEFQFYRGLKQGDPLAPFLFLLIMESLHLSLSRAIEASIFTGLKIDSTLSVSHLFYADDAVFIGEWSLANLKGIMNILRCFSLLSGMSINIQKSHFLGVGIPESIVSEAAKNIGCSKMSAPFRYLRVLVGENMSLSKAWDDSISKMKNRLPKWKVNALSIGGRLALLKSVLGSTPIYNMSIFKLELFLDLLDSVVLSNVEDKMSWDFNDDGVFLVKDVRSLLDETFLPKTDVPTWWIKSILIKVDFHSLNSYDGWLDWFKSIRLGNKSKE